LRDAMILAEFARQLDGARRVRLATEADTFPDGFVEIAAGTLNVEVTEVDKEKRRRGDEYKAGVAAGESDDDWEERAKKIPGELERCASRPIGLSSVPRTKMPAKRRPRDPAQLAKLIVDIATGEVEDREPTPEEQGKDPGAAALGKKGGAARASRSADNGTVPE
jgi:hypothetical protein